MIFVKNQKNFLLQGLLVNLMVIYLLSISKIKKLHVLDLFSRKEVSNDILNCEYEGVLGTVAGIIGIMQANEILKKILSIGKDLNSHILVLDLLNLNFIKIKF